MSVGPTLPAEVLARRNAPLKLSNLTLTGDFIRLVSIEQVKDDDLKILQKRSNGTAIEMPSNSFCHSVGEYDAEEQIWKYIFFSANKNHTFEEFKAIQIDGLNAIPTATLCIMYDIPTNSPIGIGCYMNNAPHFLKIEIGPIWISPVAQRTAAFAECMYLLTRYAFENLGYRRVEWRCDNANVRSKTAAEKFGWKFEGIGRNEIIYKNRSADGVCFGAIDSEWESYLKPVLLQRLAPFRAKL